MSIDERLIKELDRLEEQRKQAKKLGKLETVAEIDMKIISVNCQLSQLASEEEE